MSIPGPKTTLTLYKLTTSKGTSGAEVRTWSAVQVLSGSFQAVNTREREQWNKLTVTAGWVFYVAKLQFTSSANESELKEANRLIRVSPSTTYNIVGIEDWIINGGYYKVTVEEKK